MGVRKKPGAVRRPAQIVTAGSLHSQAGSAVGVGKAEEMPPYLGAELAAEGKSRTIGPSHLERQPLAQAKIETGWLVRSKSFVPGRD